MESSRRSGEELPPMHARRIYADMPPEVQAQRHAEHVAVAREALVRRREQGELTTKARGHLRALQAAAERILEQLERQPGGRGDVQEAQPRLDSAFATIETLLLKRGVAMTDGSVLDLEWREWWTLDVQCYLTSAEMEEILNEERPTGLRRHADATRRKATKAAGKRRRRVLSKLGELDEYKRLTKKNGAAKR